jgi:hypothetical protein
MGFAFYLNKKNDKFHIRLRYTYRKGSRCDFFIGVYVSDKKHFNPNDSDNPVKKLDSDYERKNWLLKDLKRKLEDILDVIRINKKLPTAVLLKERYSSFHKNSVYETNNEIRINQYFVLKIMREYIIESQTRVRIGDGLRLSSFQKVERILHKWEKFFKAKKMIEIQFEDLRHKQSLFKDFAQWCLNDDNKFANSSINKYSTTFRSFLRWAKKMDYHNIDLMRFDSPNLKEVSNRSILALTPEQLQHIFTFDEFNYLNKDGQINENCLKYKEENNHQFYIEDNFTYREYNSKGTSYVDNEFSKKYTSLEVYKDFFCFLCSTSLAYIDAAQLKTSDFNYDKDCFELKRVKTNTPTTIPMNEMSRAIWMKYVKDKNSKRQDGLEVPLHYLFPRFNKEQFYSNQRCNDALKVIGKVLKSKLSNLVNIEIRAGGGVKKGSDIEVPLYTKLHTHMGRKTFTTFALSQKIAPIDIKKITGHTNENIFKHYVNSLREEVKEEVRNIPAFITSTDIVGPRKRKVKDEEVSKSEETDLNKEKSVKDKLIELNELNNAGLITDEEYQQKRNEILKRI